MFNIQNLLGNLMASAAQTFVSSDTMYNQFCAFCTKLNMPKPSRAQFDSFVSNYNAMSPEQKLSQLQQMDQTKLSGILDKLKRPSEN